MVGRVALEEVVAVAVGVGGHRATPLACCAALLGDLER